MDAPCYIAGTGLVTVQGLSVNENWENLHAGRVLHDTGRVPIDRDPAVARVSQLAIRAAHEALRSAGRPDMSGDRTALVVGTSKGPIDEWLAQLNGDGVPDVRFGLAQVAVDVAAAMGHGRGPRLTLAGACASGLHALVRAKDLIASGACDTALVVAAESSLHALFAANFSRLGVLADPAIGCKPFDPNRQGFLLAEAAAAVWLTSVKTRLASAELGRAGILSDASHLTGTDPAGVTLERLLLDLTQDGVDLIHAHGTGTRMNDDIELQVIARICPHHRPSIYSHKHAIGHTQGASGLIAVVLNTEMHRRRCTLGNANSKTAASDRRINPTIRIEVSPEVRVLNRSIAIATGFGAAVSAVELISVNRAR